LTVCGLVLALISTNALATLYGTVLVNLYDDPVGSTLVEIDPADGTLVRTIGDVGYAVNGLTYDNTSGTLYATTSNHDPNFPDGLLTINVTTGVGTPVGGGAGILVNVPSVNSSGQMFGWHEDMDDAAVLWNKTAGTVTVLGDSGLSTMTESLAFDNNDILYLLNGDLNLYTINASTGAATLVGPVTGGSGSALHHGDFNPANNRLYTINNAGFSGNPRSIDVVDISTRTVVATLPTVDNLHTLAFGLLPSTAPVPALSSWAMFALAILLAVAATLLLRRQRERIKR
jgi:hypothetical protein